MVNSPLIRPAISWGGGHWGGYLRFPWKLMMVLSLPFLVHDKTSCFILIYYMTYFWLYIYPLPADWFHKPTFYLLFLISLYLSFTMTSALDFPKWKNNTGQFHFNPWGKPCRRVSAFLIHWWKPWLNSLLVAPPRSSILLLACHRKVSSYESKRKQSTWRNLSMIGNSTLWLIDMRQVSWFQQENVTTCKCEPKTWKTNPFGQTTFLYLYLLDSFSHIFLQILSVSMARKPGILYHLVGCLLKTAPAVFLRYSSKHGSLEAGKISTEKCPHGFRGFGDSFVSV